MLADLLFYILLAGCSVFTIERTCRKEQPYASRAFLYILFLYRIIFTLFYPLYYGETADSANYYYDENMATLMNFDLEAGLGTGFINLLTKTLRYGLGLSYIASFFFFSFIGFLGFKNLYVFISKHIMKSPNLGQNHLLQLLFFFPSFHLWSINLGKDPLVFYGITLCVYFLFDQKLSNLLVYAIGMVLIFVIRPHIALAILLTSFFVIFLSSKRIRLIYKMLLVALSTYIGYRLVPFVLDYIGLGDNPLERYQEIVQRYSNIYQGSNASIDMSNYSLGFKVFTFLFRPLFIDSPNPFALITSMENLVLLLITLRMLLSKRAYRLFFRENLLYRFSVCYTLLASVILVHTGNNLGMFSRYRNVIIPFTLIFIAAFFELKQRKLHEG